MCEAYDVNDKHLVTYIFKYTQKICMMYFGDVGSRGRKEIRMKQDKKCMKDLCWSKRLYIEIYKNGKSYFVP